MQSVDLAYEEFGQQNPETILVLHGFFASSRNWRKISECLCAKYHVYALDLRNHGNSPHHPQMDYPAMTEDVLRFMDTHLLTDSHVMGHSMGGKVAMWLALNHPGRIDKLIVADIAPKAYQHSFDKIINALQMLPIIELENRKQAEVLLAETIPQLEYRQFLLQNLLLVNGSYQWRVDLSIFLQAAHNIVAFPDTSTQEPFNGAALFLAGENSDFVRFSDTLGLFPKAEFKALADTGHWLHVQKPEVFSEEVGNFLQRRR